MIENKSVVEEIVPNSNTLYLFFGGIAAGIAMPPLEFYNSSQIIEESKIFFRDFSQCWYQDGLSDISKDILSTSSYIETLINEIKPQKLFFVGNSMGGYAAILFSTLIGSGEAIAFSPQTFISPIMRLVYHDNRWRQQIWNTYKRSVLKPKVWDLKPLLRRSKGNQKITIFVSKDDPLDMIHASHLRSISNVRIFEFDGGGHNVVRKLRDEGKLASIMSGTFT